MKKKIFCMGLWETARRSCKRAREEEKNILGSATRQGVLPTNIARGCLMRLLRTLLPSTHLHIMHGEISRVSLEDGGSSEYSQPVCPEHC